MSCTPFSLNNRLNAPGHRPDEVGDDCQVQLTPDFFENLAILLQGSLGLGQSTTELSEALMELYLEHMPKVLNRIEIGRIGWPVHNLNVFFCKESHNISGFMTWCIVLHEDEVV